MAATFSPDLRLLIAVDDGEPQEIATIAIPMKVTGRRRSRGRKATADVTINTRAFRRRLRQAFRALARAL